MKAEPAAQTPEQIAAALEAYLADFPHAVVSEDGKVLFDLREARYSLSTEHDRCTLHLWGEDRNVVRRVSCATVRASTLRLTTHKFSQTRPAALDFAGDKDHRSPSTREATRTRFLKLLERSLLRHFPQWKPESFRTAMDLEKSFGPAYARGLLAQGTQAWAVIAVNAEESSATIDGILTFGILWLEACREQAAGRRHVQGLKVVVPVGSATLTLSRMAWLAGDGWELLELDERTEELTAGDPRDQGNLATRLIHAPDPAAAETRFAEAAARILALVPAAQQGSIEQRLRSGAELAFLLHGLEFARVRVGASPASFNRMEQITFGAGANETPLAAETEPALRDLVARLAERRTPRGSQRDPLFRMQPERWLEGELRRNLTLLDAHLNADCVYTQVAAFAARNRALDRGMLDLLSVSDDGRLAVIELKAGEDPQLALQGLDYWVRVRWHNEQPADPVSNLGEFQRHGYFRSTALSPLPPRLFLVAPALRIHPATEVILRHFSARVDWTLLALNERWREGPKVIWRKRSTDSR